MIPVVDFESYNLETDPSKVDASVLKGIGSQIADGFSSIGFCYLKNHGVPQDALEDLKQAFKEFFQQPEDVKKKYVRGKEKNFGWVSVERERLNPERPGDLKEAFNFTPAEGPADWPNERLKELNYKLYNICMDLTNRVLDALSVGLELKDPKFLRNCHACMGKEWNTTTLRSLYYPPLPADKDIKPGQIRLGEHSDYGSITLLFQDNVGGLEVQVPGGEFIPATPIPGTVLVNIGDLMQRWTSDKLVATKHRVTIPEEEVKKRESRQSFAFFVQPDNDFIIRCLDGSDKYEPISSLDYLKYRFSVTY